MYQRFRDLRSLPVLGLLPLLENTVERKKLKYNHDTGMYDLNYDETITPRDRLKYMFSLNEFGTMSPPLMFVTNATVCSLIAGVAIGGIQGSLEAKERFIRNMDAVAFYNSHDGRKRFYDSMTFGFFKSGLKTGISIAAFMGIYATGTTALSLHRGEFRFYDHTISAAVGGALHRFNFGLRGMFSGAVIGGGLGTIGGLIATIYLYITNKKMEDVWHAAFHIMNKRRMFKRWANAEDKKLAKLEEEFREKNFKGYLHEISSKEQSNTVKSESEIIKRTVVEEVKTHEKPEAPVKLPEPQPTGKGYVVEI